MVTTLEMRLLVWLVWATSCYIHSNICSAQRNGNSRDQPQGGSRGFKRICYFSGWSLKRNEIDARTRIEDIDPFVCTHIIYAFATINTAESKLQSSEWDDESTKTLVGSYDKLNNLKKVNPRLRTMLSIGGAKAGSFAFDLIVNNPESQWAFIENTIDYLRRWRFDGLDIDWEYPGLPEKGTTEETKFLFSQFLKDFREAFENEAGVRGKRRLLLSAAVGVGRKHFDGAYEVDKISKYVDFLNVMAYDFHGGWDRFTGGNSPLVSRAGNFRFDQSLSQEWAIQQWISKGAPRSKLMLGIPAQGRSFTLKNDNENGVGAPSTGHGQPGDLIGIQGIMSLYEVCLFVDKGAHRRWDKEQFFPYAFYQKQWVGYENPRSVKIKAEWIVSQKLGGAMVWSLDLDDFSGKFCGAGEFPLTNAIKKAFHGHIVKERPTRRNKSKGTIHVNSMLTMFLVFICIIKIWF